MEKWNFWRKIRDWCNKRMDKAWMKGGNCDSRCPLCKQWESHGILINTEPLSDGLELRKCENCGYQWKAIFTPAGFMRVDTGPDIQRMVPVPGSSMRKTVQLKKKDEL